MHSKMRLLLLVLGVAGAACAAAMGCAGGSGDAATSLMPQKGVVYFIDDHMGSAYLVTDSLGNVVHEENRFPYGVERSSEGVGDSANYAYTGKEYDEETDLIYFGGRFYAPELGRWTTSDPKYVSDPSGIPANSDASNLYAYAHDNPVNFVDPDGRDAVPIVFPDYKISTPLGRLPYIGHAGILLINNKTGLTKYYEYGRYDPENMGQVRSVAIPNVIMGQDGAPTEASLNNAMAVISKQSGHGGRIVGAYIRDDNFEQMNNYAMERFKLNDNSDREGYDIIGNNCMTFAKETVEAAGVQTPLMIDPRPNSYVEELRDTFTPYDWKPSK